MPEWEKQADKVESFRLNGRQGFRLFLAVVDAGDHIRVVQQPLPDVIVLEGIETTEAAKRLALERLAADLAVWQAEIAQAILQSIPKVERLLHISNELRFVYLTRIPTPQTVAHLWHRQEHATRTCCNKPLGTSWMVVPEDEAHPHLMAQALPIGAICQACRTSVEVWEPCPTWQSAPPLERGRP